MKHMLRITLLGEGRVRKETQMSSVVRNLLQHLSTPVKITCAFAITGVHIIISLDSLFLSKELSQQPGHTLTLLENSKLC